MATNQDQSGAGPQGRSTTFETHPLYKERLEDWTLMEDAHAGERRVKERGFQYLPATPGQRQDGLGVNDPGLADYVAYKKRAVFHDVVKEAVQSMVGVMHRKDPTIKLPKRLEGMMSRATPDGETLPALLRKINEQQLINARVGLLVEVPTGQTVADAMPFVATYNARTLINWDTGVSDQGLRRIEMVALDESAWERRGLFRWDFEQKTRVLMSDLGQLDASEEPAQPGYHVAVLRDGRLEPTREDFHQPSIGGRTAEAVPFVFVNANDLTPDPEAPPLLGLANIAMALYRSDADYRQNLFMQGQDTLVITGDTDGDGADKRTGAGAIIDLPKGGTAEYIGVSAEGLDAQHTAIRDLLETANERGSKLLDIEGGGLAAESGEALKVRVAARTTTLTSIAKTGAEGLKQALRMAASWVGADPDEVDVAPNLEFSDSALTGQDMLNFAQAKQMGLPISWESLHLLMEQNDLTSFTYDEEQQKIEDEPPPLGAGSVPIMDPKTGEPMVHPETGQPLTQPAPRRGVTGTGLGRKAPAKASDAGTEGSRARAKGGKKATAAQGSGQGDQ